MFRFRQTIKEYHIVLLCWGKLQSFLLQYDILCYKRRNSCNKKSNNQFVSFHRKTILVIVTYDLCHMRTVLLSGRMWIPIISKHFLTKKRVPGHSRNDLSQIAIYSQITKKYSNKRLFFKTSVWSLHSFRTQDVWIKKLCLPNLVVYGGLIK